MKVIDLHTHGIGGYDTKTAEVDDILKIAEIQGSCGISEILLSIYPSPARSMRENMETVRQAMQRQENGSIQSFPAREAPIPAARIIGVHLEGPFLNPARCGALDRTCFIKPTEYALQELTEGFERIIRVITVAPEIDGAARLIRKISDAGIICNMGHSDATYAEAEAGFHAGARGITHIFNAMRGFHHREPGLAGFGLLNRDVYIEVIADPFHLHPVTLDLIYRTKNHNKILIISDSIKDTKTDMSSGEAFDESRTLAGGSLTVTESSRRLIEMGYEDEVVMSCIVRNPAEFLSEGQTVIGGV